MDSDEPPVRICLLGKPTLFIGGRLGAFGGPRKAIALLAYVLLHRERALSRAALAEQFWPDEEDESARAALRRHLHRALSALPEAPAKRPWVVADKVTLRWNPAANATIDVVEYERLSSAGQCEATVALYRGDYLEDFYDEWILPERERLRELHATNLVALIEERRRALDYPSAVAHAQALLRLDPMREDAIRRLMSLRYAGGDRSGALADFEIFSRRLRDELSADPMPETLALRAAIRKNDLSTLQGGNLQTVRVARPGFPFAGRVAELQALREAWESAARGETTTAIVSGEAGIGKSRLIGELMAVAESQGGRVLFGSTAAVETEPYQPVAEALRGAIPLLRYDRLDPIKLGALSSILPEVQEHAASVARLPKLEPERDRQRLFDALEGAFENLAEKRPLLVVLEDVHWAGAATVELLEYLVRRLRTNSVLFVVSYREEEVEGNHALRGLLRRLERVRSRHVALGPLERDDVRALVAGAALEERDVFAGELFAQSEGNALFVTELLRERLSGVAGGNVPTGIAGTVDARLERLSPPARSLVETAAVAGVGFDAEVVRQACGWSYAEVFDALDELLDRALVRASHQRRGEYAFSHQLVHAAVYDAVEEGVRRGLHRRVGRTLEKLFPDRPSLHAIVARHFDAAAFAPEAVASYLRAVRYALDVFAQDEAIVLATRALQLCSDERDRFQLHRLREEAAALKGDNATRRVDCASMTQIAHTVDDEELLGTALCRTAGLFFALGELEDERANIAELHALGERALTRRWAIEAALLQSRLLTHTGRSRDAERVLAEAEQLVAASADDEQAFEYWRMRAFNAASVDTHDARAYLENAQRLAAQTPMRVIRSLRAEAKIADLEGDLPALEQVANRILNLCRDVGDLEGQAAAHQNLATSAWYHFDIKSGREHTRQALVLFEQVQKPQAYAAMLVNRAVDAQYTGDVEGARADYLRAISIFQAIGRPGECFAKANLAQLESMCGNHVRARDLASEALAYARDNLLEREEHLALQSLAIAELNLGNLERARDCFEAVLRYRRGRTKEVVDTLIEAIPVYLGLGDIGRAVAAADELLGGLEGDRMRAVFPAQGPWAAASAYAAAGKAERARDLRSEARTLLRELAGRIDDEESRVGYLSLPVHRSILGASEVD